MMFQTTSLAERGKRTVQDKVLQKDQLYKTMQVKDILIIYFTRKYKVYEQLMF